MKSKELVRLIAIAKRLVLDSKSDVYVAFSGASLFEVLHHLEQEVNESRLSGDEIVDTWEEGVASFRQALIDSATKRESIVESSEGPVTLVSEPDALDASAKCRKGPGGIRRPTETV